MSDYERSDANDDFEVFERKKKDDDTEETIDRTLAQKETRRIAPKGRTMMPSPALKDDDDSEIYSGRRAQPTTSRTDGPRASPSPLDEDDDSEILSDRPDLADQRAAATARSATLTDEDDDSELYVRPDPSTAPTTGRPDHEPMTRSRPATDEASQRAPTERNIGNIPRSEPHLADVWFDAPKAKPTAAASAPTHDRPTEAPAPDATSAIPLDDDRAADAAAEFANLLAPPARPMTMDDADDDPVPHDTDDAESRAHDDDAHPDMHIEEGIGLPPMPDAPLTTPRPTPRADPAPSTPTPTTHTTPERTTAFTPHPTPGGPTMRLAIACTEFNYDITRSMLERAQAHAKFLGCDITATVHAPGVYDLPFVVQRLIRRDDVDGVVTLGVVIEGDTDHDDLVIQHAARKIIDLSLQHDKPVGLGITGPGMSRLQAEARIDRAKDAVEAVVKLGRTHG